MDDPNHPGHPSPDVIVNAGKVCKGTPGGRYRTDGPQSAEAFREDHLVPALRRAAHGTLRVQLVEAKGWPASWLEEAFGGLERHHHTLLDKVALQIESFEPIRREVASYMTEARASRIDKRPTTELLEHEARALRGGHV